MVLGQNPPHGGNVQAVFAPADFRCGFPRPSLAPSATSAPPASTPLPALYAPPPRSAHPRRRGYEGAGIGIQISVKQPSDGLDLGNRPSTPSSDLCAASANEDSPCSTTAGAPSSAISPAPARSPRYHAPPLSSPTTNTDTSNDTPQFADISVGAGPRPVDGVLLLERRVLSLLL